MALFNLKMTFSNLKMTLLIFKFTFFNFRETLKKVNLKLKKVIFKLEKVILKLKAAISSHSETGKGHVDTKKDVFASYGGTQNRRGFLGGSREGPGVVLGWFWCSGVVLGSVLGCPNVDISMIIMMF